MHANTAQVQVQMPTYYSLGSVAMNNNLGFGANHHSIDHNGHPNNTNNATATSLHPYHASNNNNALYHNNNNNHHHQGYHGQQNYTTSQHGHNTNGNNHAYHNDFQKTIPIQNQVDIYQPPHQSLDSDLMNPIVNRQLNNQYASNYHNYHQQHYSPSQHPSYHYNNNENNNDSNNAAATREEPQQADQPRSNASTPTPTLTSSLSTVSSASTPSLSSNTLSLQGNNDYTYNNNNRQTSPASSIATTSSTFHVPASPEQLAMGTHLPSPLASHNVNMTQQQTMPAWTTNNGSCVDPELSSQQQQQSMSPREHVSFNGNASPKNDRPYYPTTTAQPAAHLYSAPQDHQQQQMWVTSMPSDASQDILEQDRHHQRSYSQSSRNSSALGSYNNDGHGHNQPSVASQQPTLPAMGGLPLLSPTSMLQSDYQPSSYPMNIHETPTVMSHTDYPSVNSSNNNNNNESRYGPIRTAHKKSSSRPGSIGSQRDFNTRTRTNSLNSTSSASSNGALSNLTNTLGTASLAASAAPSSLTLTTTHEQDEDEDSDSPTTIQIRPRINATPRKAVAARVFECSVPGCNKAYTQLHNLKSHERTGHTPVIKLKPFLCIIEGCTKAFSQRKSLASHIKTAHADFKFKPFKCSQDGCQKSYTQLHNLRTHEKTVHMVDLSRKRVKNPSMGGGMVGLGGLGGPSSSCSPPFNSLDMKAHHHQQHHQQHHHQGQMSYHSGLGLGYDGLSDLDLGHGAATGHPEDAYHYQRQHDQQHHHQAYSRMPHLNPMAGMYSR